jgi:hypothetical protein
MVVPISILEIGFAVNWIWNEAVPIARSEIHLFDEINRE